MNTKKIESIIKAISSAHIIKVVGFIMTHKSPDYNKEILIKLECEDFGDEFQCNFTPKAIENAIIKDNTITMNDLDDTPVKIELFTLTPINLLTFDLK